MGGLHAELFSWGGDPVLWRNHSELRLTNHNHGGLHCVYTSFLMPKESTVYGNWPADTEKTIRFCVKPSGQPMLPFDVTTGQSFQHMQFSVRKDPGWRPDCRAVSLAANTPIAVGHNLTYEPAETDFFLDYGQPVSVLVRHGAFYGCLADSLRLNAIGAAVTTPDDASLGETLSYAQLAGSLPHSC